MNWFHDLTGFHETTWEETRAKLQVADGRLTSRVNGRSWAIGSLETPSLAELRERIRPHARGGSQLRVRNQVADARTLHTQPEARGALIQVASQFNLLEMTGPGVTPEQGVTIYAHDPTQGPACAIAAGAATIYRNYFADTGAGLGQTRNRQVDTLRDLARALAPEGMPMRNGYALPEQVTLQRMNTRLAASDVEHRDHLRGLLRIGLHRDVEVTEPGPGQGQRVTQAFCSALPVAYSGIPPKLWEPFARLVLEAAYEATLWAAVEQAARGGAQTVYLTLLGGGAFGNDMGWILDALRFALNTVRGYALDVRIVSYRSVPAALDRLTREFETAENLKASPQGTNIALDVDHDGDAEPRPHGNCYWLARGRILAGEYPRTADPASSRAKIVALLDANVRRFVDLTEPFEGLEPYAPLLANLAAERDIAVTHVRHAIPDLGVPSVEGMRTILDTLLEPHEGVTYVHCWGGIGRTGTVVGCALIETGFSADAAIALIARKWRSVDKAKRRPQSPETGSQFAFIRGWETLRRG